MTNFSEKNSIFTRRCLYEVVLQQYTDGIVSLCGLDSDMVPDKGKGLVLLTKVSTCLNFYLLLSSQVFWVHIQLNKY